LRPPQNLDDLKWGVVEEIEKLGYVPEILTNPKGSPPARLSERVEPSRRR
jgi:hypothetical protein